MSETETWVGTLKPTGKTVAEYMEGKECPSYLNLPDDMMEWFTEEFYTSAVVTDGFVYEVERRCLSDQDIAISSVNDDGSISFTVSYYNGGCSFDEAIEAALKNLE